jgi:predicted permease
MRSALSSVFGHRNMEQEMNEELRFHIENETTRLIASGVAPEDARRQAMLAFGGMENVREEVRDARGARWFQDLMQDVHYARRTLLRRPGFAAIAVLTLAIGIGATTALFGVVKAVLLTPLPYREPERVAVIWSAWKGFDQTWLSFDEYEAYEHEVKAFENVALYSDLALNLTEGDQPERFRAGAVMHDVFSILGVSPILGRGFTPDEDRPNGPAVIVLGYDLWQRRFNGDAAIVGKEIQVNGRATQVVGVMPSGFKLPLDFGGSGATHAWIPLATDAAANGAVAGPAWSMQGQSHGYYGVARMRPGATIEQVNAQLKTSVDMATDDGVYPTAMLFRAFARTANEQVTGKIAPVLLVVLGAVGFVLLIACANVAGLMLVRGEARRRELAVRVALGASGQRLTRQLLTESFVLAGVGGTVGVLLAAAGVWLIKRVAPGDLPRFSETTLDLPLLAFALATSLGAAILAGVLPALQANRGAPAGDLKDGARGATTGIARLRWRQALVSIEVALAVVLVCGAGLMVRSVSNLFAIDPGFDSSNVLTMRLTTPAAFYTDPQQIETFHTELNRRVSEIAGVKSVGTVRLLPLASEMGDWGVQVEGYTPPPHQGTPADWQIVMPGYFETMGLELVDGRVFEERDVMDAPLALIVNRRFVEMYLGGGTALGRKVRIGGPSNPQYTIVGVVGNVRHNGLTREVKAQFYATLGQFARSPGNPTRSASLVIKTTVDPLTLVPAVRSIIRDIDPRLPVSEIRTMDDVVAGSIAAPRFAMGLLGLFGILALVLSSVGIFGIVAQLVAARQHEFGIRAALGASPRDLVALSVKGGVTQTLAGLVIGIAAALALTRVMIGLLEGVTPTDVPTFAAVVAITGVIAMMATIGPARRAAKADPMAVLHDG